MGTARFEQLTGTIDGSNLEFSSSVPYAAGTTAVFLNGQLKLSTNDDGWLETDPDAGIITMKEAPQVGDVVQAFYLDRTVEPTTTIVGTLVALRRFQGTLRPL